MNKDKWEVIKIKVEKTLKWWEIDKKTNQFTVDSIHSLFPTELEVIIDYIAELETENQQLKHILDELENWLKSIQDYHIIQKGKCDNEFNYSLEDEDINVLQDVLDKIKELRGRENE